MSGESGDGHPARVATQRRLQSGRARAATIAPYLAAALFALRPHETSDVETMAVTPAYDLYWSPNFVATLDVEQCAAVLVHEVSHLLRHHAQRGAAIGVTDQTRRSWNIACDMAINSDLRDMGLDLPAGVFTEDLGVQARLSAEEIFARITALDHDTLGSGHHPDCGPGAGGDPRSWEDTPEIAQGAEIAEAIARKVARAIVSAGTRGGDSGHGSHSGAPGMSSGSPGTIPGARALWAEEVLEDRIDWRTQLAKLTRRALVRQGATDYTTRRLARRDADPFVLASMAAPAPPRCVAVVDTSGSTDERELGTALAELASLVRALRGQPIDVVLCDTAATVARRVLEPRALELRGGAGRTCGSGSRPQPSCDLRQTSSSS